MTQHFGSSDYALKMTKIVLFHSVGNVQVTTWLQHVDGVLKIFGRVLEALDGGKCVPLSFPLNVHNCSHRMGI